jgi:hypothetical protein
VLSLLLAAVAFGSSLADYRERVESSQKNIESMMSIIESQKSLADADSYLSQTEATVKKALPDSENVEFRGTSIEVSNGWMRSKLDEFDHAAAADERISILTSISERLDAINTHLRELEVAVASERSKDEDKQKLADILRRPEYQKPEKKDDSLFQRWVSAFLKWLRDLFPHPDIAPGPSPDLGPLSVVLQVVIYGVIIALIGFLIYKFAPVVLRRLGEKEKKDAKSRVILGEHIDASISARDLFAEAEKLARNGDLRGAIRKGYVALLCDLADKKVIGLARHKTNRDYLRDVRKRPTLFERMKHATGSFERHWYGFGSPAAADWEDFREQYQKAVKEA